MNAIIKAAATALALVVIGSGLAAAQAPHQAPAAPQPRSIARQTPIARPVAPRPAPSRISTTAAAAAAAAAGTLEAYVPTQPATPDGARLLATDPLPPAELEAFVDGVMRDAMLRDHVAGAAVSVVQHGRIVLNKGYGFASLSPARPVDPDRTLFRIGSISKTFTWIALMREVEAGRIRLEAPINLYLPEKPQVRDQGFSTPVRVSNLMDHSAGFEDRALGHLMEARPDRERPLDLYLRQERPRRVREPGAVASYSNYGAALAGEAVSYVAQKPFERLIEDEILIPMALNHTTFREPRPADPKLAAPMPASLAADLADGYRWTPGGYQRRGFEYIGHIAPAGSASSSAGDMARYMAMLLNGGTLDTATIFGPRAAQAFRTPLRRTPAGINGWAHGFAISALPAGRRGYGHDGATLSFMSNMVVVPDLGLGVFVATNTDTGAPLAHQLPERILQQFYAPPEARPRAGADALVKDRGRFEGDYISTRRPSGGLEAFVTLLSSGVGITVTPDGLLTTRGRGGVRIWSPEGDVTQGRFNAADGPDHLVFGIRPGEPVNFTTSANGGLFERVSFWKRPMTLLALAGAAGIAAVATLVGVLFRNRREFRETSIQALMSQVQNAQAALWIGTFLLFLLWVSKTSDVAEVMYGWPGSMLVLASACALVAAALTGFSLIFLPSVWRGGRRVDSWTSLRKAGFCLTALTYAAFSVALGLWGALAPWSG